MPLGRRRRTQRTPASVAASASDARSHQPPLSRLVARGEVSVKREVLATCLTCPLCWGLLRDATTIPECLHTCKFSPLPSPSTPGPLSDRSRSWSLLITVWHLVSISLRVFLLMCIHLFCRLASLDSLCLLCS
jgi:hypothetical protein